MENIKLDLRVGRKVFALKFKFLHSKVHVKGVCFGGIEHFRIKIQKQNSVIAIFADIWYLATVKLHSLVP